MPWFEHDGNRIAYAEHGEGPRPLVLLPGLLFSQRMQEPLAQTLAARGNRVITLDPLGHGDSDRPRDMWRYSMTAFGGQVVGLLDHLGIEQAVVGGASLGANVTLEVAAAAPQRLRGMVLEMPVLDNALLGCAICFTPLMVSLTFGEPAMKLLQRVARVVPRRPLPLVPEILLDWVSQDPGPSAAVLQGLFFGRIAPHRDLRRGFTTPSLVIGHKRDPIHPFSDADGLAAELPQARLLNADSIFELRTRPQRLTAEIGDFVDACWKPTAAPGPTGASAAATAPRPRRRPRARSGRSRARAQPRASA
ncbi:alpha/beta hydrolase [Conexibacter sp. JD483]|uniref:alpha/beta fold hydrolase n=1 Tax=unclassified Conexibacter TaxID=2627773 RepID=UPI002715BA5E|nr:MULTISPECIES: alpha/beta hydrolase [unclassified Conexibacter]MDO8186338.1 alpha/beta hydrolase [Conexibacter sp. CPCC 205706]MDO8197543.1 alpha/beta hydrolase [Conexibacter sp. CPCC 205762]MDR9369635.1 alpha/beta hydrolase [Conexibacter sp. JD483]